jgi:hypothetical protein
MIGCDSDFTITKNFTLAIISEGEATTYRIILLKRRKHLFSGHMIYASTI